MKKLLLLLLLATTVSFGQTTLANKLKITGNITSTTATKVNVQEANGEINTIAKLDLIDNIFVASVGDLPTIGVDEKIYTVRNLSKIYRWNGTYYQELAFTDISGKVDKVTGKSLISDTEITRLAGVYNVDISGKVDKNTAITGATNTKITYDSKGLVTGGTSLMASDIPILNQSTTGTASTITGSITESQVTNLVTDLSNKQSTSQKNIANGYAGLGTDGKLISGQLPDITISDTFVTASQAAMLALIAQTGDVSVRTDLNKSFILKANDPTLLANWQELLTPTSAVTTVFGRNGAITAQTGDYNATQVGAPSGSGNSTGTNTGDNSVNTLYSGLVSNATHTGDATGATALTVKGINGTQLSTLATGILKNTTTTGVPSIAIASDFPTLNQNTTGTASNITGTYVGSISSSQVTTGLGFTPYNSTNPSGFISSTQTYNIGTTSNALNRASGAQTLIGVSIDGNAGSATNWGGQGSNLAEGIKNDLTPISLAGLYSNGGFYQYSAGRVASFLGLGSNAYNSTAYLPLNSAFGGDVNQSSLSFSGKLFAALNSANAYGSFISFGEGGYLTQFNSDPNKDGNIYVRVSGDGGIGTWRKMWHNGNFNPANYLPLTGGTLTGVLNGTSAAFSSSVTASGFFNQSSDRRLKTIIKRDGEVAYFKWNKKSSNKDDTKTHIGYIAQEIRKEFPDQVQKGENGYLTVSYIEILVEKVRQLEKRLNAQEKKIKQLQKRK